MERCRQCDAPLAKTDVNCVTCGANLKPDTKKATFQKRFQKGVTVMFFISATLMVASLFTSSVPSFFTCFGVTIVLYMVRSSAGEMTQASEE